MKNILITIIAVSFLIFSGILLANGTDGVKGNPSTTNTPNQTNQDMPMGRMNQEMSTQMPMDPNATGQNSMPSGITGSTSGMGSGMGSGIGSGSSMGSSTGSGMGSGTGSGIGSGMGSGSGGGGMGGMGGRR